MRLVYEMVCENILDIYVDNYDLPATYPLHPLNTDSVLIQHFLLAYLLTYLLTYLLHRAKYFLRIPPICS
jgi:hypothetical protein